MASQHATIDVDVALVDSTEAQHVAAPGNSWIVRNRPRYECHHANIMVVAPMLSTNNDIKKNTSRRSSRLKQMRPPDLSPMYITLPPESTVSSTGDDAFHDVNVAADVAVSKLQSPTVPVLLVNLSHIRSQLLAWSRCLPRVQPYQILAYGIDKQVAAMLNDAGCQLACATIPAIDVALQLGANSQRLLPAMPRASREQLRIMYSKGLRTFSFYDAGELRKLADECPQAELLLSVSVAGSPPGIRFGARCEEWRSLLQLSKELGLQVIGASLRVGSGQSQGNDLDTKLRSVLHLWEEAADLGIEMTLLDLGSIQPFGSQGSAESMATAIHKSLSVVFPEPEFPNLKIIADAGQMCMAGAATLLAHIESRLPSLEEDERTSSMTEYKLNGGPSDLLRVMLSLCCARILPEVFPQIKDMCLPARLLALQQDGTCAVVGEASLPEIGKGTWLLWPSLDNYDLFCRGHCSRGSLQLCYYTTCGTQFSEDLRVQSVFL